MSRLKGKIQSVSTSAASSVFDLREQVNYQRDGIWPFIPPPTLNIVSYETGGATISNLSVTLTRVSSNSTVFAFLSDDYSYTGYSDVDFTEVFYDTAFDATSTAYAAYSSLGSGNITWNFTWDTVSPSGPVVFLVEVEDGQYEDHANSTINTQTAPDLTMSAGDLSLIVLYGQDENQTYTPPAGYTLVDRVYQTGDASSVGGGSHQSVIAIAYKNITVSGTESPGSWTGGAAGNMMRVSTFRISRV